MKKGVSKYFISNQSFLLKKFSLTYINISYFLNFRASEHYLFECRSQCFAYYGSNYVYKYRQPFHSNRATEVCWTTVLCETYHITAEECYIAYVRRCLFFGPPITLCDLFVRISVEMYNFYKTYFTIFFVYRKQETSNNLKIIWV